MIHVVPISGLCVVVTAAEASSLFAAPIKDAADWLNEHFGWGRWAFVAHRAGVLADETSAFHVMMRWRGSEYGASLFR